MSDEFKQFHNIELSELAHVEIGRHAAHTLMFDPRRLAFMLARYKFVAKMLEGSSDVLEIGCADGFGSNIVAQAVESLTISDFDQRMVDEADRTVLQKNIQTERLNILNGPYLRQVDAIYLMDVLEHIDPNDEQLFLGNIAKSLKQDGTCIIGMPSLESQVYASPGSKEGHVNCKSGNEFKRVCREHFRSVFLFSGNDEIIHTGYSKMAHYLIALCVGVNDSKI